MRRMLCALLMTGVLASSAVARADETVALADVPAGVQVTLEGLADGGELLEIVRTTRDGESLYQAKILVAGGILEIVVMPDGTIVSLMAEGDIPPEAKATIESFSKAGRLIEVAKVTEDGVTHYQAKYLVTGGILEVDVNPAGLVIGMEVKEGNGLEEAFIKGPGESGSTEAGGPLEKKVRDLAAKVDKVEEKLDEKEEEKKPKFAEFAARLKLDDYQQSITDETLRRGKEELLELWQRPLPDGTNLLDDLAEAIYLGAGEPEKAGEKWGQFIGKFMGEKIPGTDQTFMAAHRDLNSRLRSEMKAGLSEEQKREFDAWNPEPTDVELDDDPLGAYIGEYMQRRAESEGR